MGGFVFTKDDPSAGIDLDECRDPQTGELNAFAQNVIEKMNSYTELSPSGKGLHIWVEGKLPGSGINQGHIEMYDNKRYFTVTGQTLPGYPSTIESRDAELKSLYHEVTTNNEKAEKPQTASGKPLNPEEEKLIARGATKYGPRFRILWDGGQDSDEIPSQGDLALCTMLSVLTHRNAKEIERVFRLSGRMRDKWDEVHYDDGRTYGQVTLEKAVAESWKGTEKHESKSASKAADTSLPRETDVGNGKRLVAKYGEDLRYCHRMNSWLTWTGERWLLERHPEHHAICQGDCGSHLAGSG